MDIIRNKKTITYTYAFLFVICIIFTACSSFNSEEKAGEIVLTVDQAMVKAAEHSARAADIFEPGTYLEVEIKGGYTASQTIPLVLGRKIIFKGIPVETSVHAEAMLYRNQQDGSKNILYNGTSDSVKISSGENKISLKLKKYVPGGNGGGGNGGNGNNVPDPNEFVEISAYTIDGSKLNLVADSSFSDGAVTYTLIPERTNLPISRMYVCTHEVTQKEYEKYMLYQRNYSNGDPDYREHPTGAVGENVAAYGINWVSAIMYCNLRSADEHLNPVYYILLDSNGAATYTESDTTTRVYDVAQWVGKFDFQGESYIREHDGKYYVDGRGSAMGQVPMIVWYPYIKYDISKNGYRLPTEVEWEYLARGGSEGLFLAQGWNGGGTTQSKSEVGNVSTNTYSEVRSKTANYLGLFDMVGNVKEWCWDAYVNHTNATYKSSGILGPEHASGIPERVLRGGSCSTADPGMATIYSIDYQSGDTSNYAGIRVVRTIQ